RLLRDFPVSLLVRS
ncbi:hypothetical protein, partial [Frankia sp. AvcI1]